MVSMATKRRADYYQQAETLAKKVKTLENLEKLMKLESRAIVRGLKDKQMRIDEYERSLIDKTIISALAGVYLGSEKANPTQKMEKSWPTVVGDMLPPLSEFLEETKSSIDNGKILIGDATEEFSEVTSWIGLLGRVIRYVANPAYSFFNLGDYYVRQEQGYTQMRRIPQADARVCADCQEFGDLGWQPLGSLPMPGRECMCYDNCRCRIEYR